MTTITLRALAFSAITALATGLPAQSSPLCTSGDYVSNWYDHYQFDLEVTRASGIRLESLDFRFTAGNFPVALYFRSGSGVGHEWDPTGWTLHDNDTLSGNGETNRTEWDIADLELPLGQYSIVVEIQAFGQGATTHRHINSAPPSNADLVMSNPFSCQELFTQSGNYPYLLDVCLHYGTLPTPRLTVAAHEQGPVSVPVTVSPQDIDGLGAGTTPATFEFPMGTTVTATVPASLASGTVLDEVRVQGQLQPTVPSIDVPLGSTEQVVEVFYRDIAPFEPDFGQPLGLDDEGVSRGHTLGFPFPMPGGDTTHSIDICANGYIWLETGLNLPSDPTPSAQEFANAGKRICALWQDLVFTASADVYFHALPGRAVVTWSDARLSGSSARFTVQCQLFESGRILLAYRGELPSVTPTVVGWAAPGSGPVAGVNMSNAWNSGERASVVQPIPSFDAATLARTAVLARPNGSGGYFCSPLPATLADSGNYGSGCGSVGEPTLTASTPPALGATVILHTANVPPAPIVGAVMIGLQPLSLDLAVIDMPGCRLRTSAEFSLPMTPIGRAVFPIALESSQVGLQLYAQSALLDPAANALGVSVSNGLMLYVGEL